MLNSPELLNRHFEKAGFGGYKAADVEAFINDVRTYMAAQNKEIADLKRKLDEAVKKSSEYVSQSESLKNTLLNAQIVADKTIADAKKETEKLIADTKTAAAASLSSTKIKVENMLDCAEGEVAMRKEEAATIKAETYEFKLNLMKLYRAQIELINEIPAEKPAQTSAETADSEEEVIEEAKTEADVEEVKTGDSVCEPAVVKPEPIESSKKTDEKLKTPEAAKPEEKKPEEAPIAAPEKKTEEEAAPTLVKTVKLNLKYNEKTGEYEPLGADDGRNNEPEQFNFGSKKGKNGDGLKFGADYNIRTDSFEK